MRVGIFGDQYKPEIARVAHGWRDKWIIGLEARVLELLAKLTAAEDDRDHYRIRARAAELGEQEAREELVRVLTESQPVEAERDEAKACLEFLLREQINGVICPEDHACERCARNWARVRKLLD